MIFDPLAGGQGSHQSFIQAAGRVVVEGGMVFLFLELHPSQLDVNIHPAKTEVRFREDAGIYELVRRALERRSFPSWLQAERVAEQEESYGTDRSSGFSLIGQIENTFLLTLSEGHLYLLDQHAAEERVLYERLQQGKARSRELIAPQVVTLSAEERTFLDEHQAEVAACGFAVEPFGPQAFALRAIPDFLDPKEVGLLFSRLLTRVRGQKEDFRQALACLGAVKAGEPLAREAQERLLASWVQTTNPHACAHNRPIYFRLSLDEVRRKVGRTGLSCEFDREEE